ncbi:MAG: 50S ribosomal protein L11 methyltransferase [Desulfobacterota bacterium]|nr:50S ribosomal protein L11 methyltransferase [Thermodesulfobacteriota bacterium]MDW8001117.1 50S ribosomal protein L11 methyltransferase [Deltaproteobacteria bacterium]
MDIWKLRISVPKGTEELLPEDVYELANGGIILEEKDYDLLNLIFYTKNPETLLSLLEEKVQVIEYSLSREEPKDYEKIVKNLYKPVKIGDIYVVCPWHKVKSPTKSIVIEPGMAFGTGRHESTKIMMLLMSKTNFKSKDVADLGCGSAILSIYASILGAKEILGVDIDGNATLCAKKNVDLNRLSNVRIEKMDLKDVQGEFDVVLANLDLYTFMSHMEHVKRLARRGGTLIISGILGREKKRFLKLTENLHLKEELRIGSWVGFRFKKP